MDDKTREILVITQEECAEIIQAISKIFRFGNPFTNIAKLEEEIGDLMCMFAILVENGIVSEDTIEDAKIRKYEKLKEWSSIFK